MGVCVCVCVMVGLFFFFFFFFEGEQSVYRIVHIMGFIDFAVV